MKNVILGTMMLVISLGGACFAQSNASLENVTVRKVTTTTNETTSITTDTYPSIDKAQTEKNVAYLINASVIEDKNEVK